jgi:phosphinothricin acetyltransferase
MHTPVVDSVFDTIAAAWLGQVDVQLHINLEVLRLLSFGWTHAMPPAEHHALQHDLIHIAIVARRRLIISPTDRLIDWNREPVLVPLPSVTHADLTVRAGAERDLEQLNDIYNGYVKETHFTFDIEPMTIEARRDWFSHYGTAGRHRLLVAVSDQAVVGFACSSRFRPRAAYETSVETTIYLAPDAVGRGAGSMLYGELFQALEAEDVHRAYAGIGLPNPASIALHERFGFKRVAHFTEQGRKFGRYWDVAWYEKPFGGEPVG